MDEIFLVDRMNSMFCHRLGDIKAVKPEELGVYYVYSGDSIGALHVLEFWFSSLPPPSSLAAAKSKMVWHSGTNKCVDPEPVKKSLSVCP